MQNKTNFLFTNTLNLPVIQRHHIYQCLVKKKNESFLKNFNDCYSQFMKWLVNDTAYYENMKGYYYKAETYLCRSPEQIKATQHYLTLSG